MKQKSIFVPKYKIIQVTDDMKLKIILEDTDLDYVNAEFRTLQESYKPGDSYMLMKSVNGFLIAMDKIGR